VTMARAHRFDPAVTRWYYCITRRVRRAFLLGEGDSDRKEWIENRLRELAELFSIAVGGFAGAGLGVKLGFWFSCRPDTRVCPRSPKAVLLG
jgi:hypothetical protein